MMTYTSRIRLCAWDSAPQFNLFTEIPFKQSFEGFAVAGFVAGHFMHGVVVGLRPTGLGFWISFP